MARFLDECLACYDVALPVDKCLAATPTQNFACLNAQYNYCLKREMLAHEKHSAETLQQVWHIWWTIVPTLFCFALARVITQVTLSTASNSTLRFGIEFFIIVLPTVLCVNVINRLVEYIVAAGSLSLMLLIWRTNCFERARERKFEFGRRPCILTLVRVTISYLTALCILAIDFENFPKSFRKSRRFGAGLMDVGIGLFIFSMGSVSRKPKNTSDLHRLFRLVTPILILGVLRTVVIVAIDYHQDEHEYGIHLNAFFTLGLTKLFGTMLSGVATAEEQLLPLGLGTLALHEIALQFGVSDFVMNVDLQRNNFWTANREGLCSLPGFVGIYILSMYIGQWLQAKPILSYNEFIGKLKSLVFVSAGIWMVVLVSIFVIGIARVTCNFGYAAWILAIAVTVMMLFMIIFDLALNTLWPLDSQTQISGGGEGEYLLKTNSGKFQIPTLIEALNSNGLTFFLIANVLTGGVNIFLKPENRTEFESIAILSLYMLVATACVYILYRLKIRIA